MLTSPYTMWIEKPSGTVVQHGFHLGTIRDVAERLVLERLRHDPYVVSIALRQDGKLVRIYDYRDLEDALPTEECEDEP